MLSPSGRRPGLFLIEIQILGLPLPFQLLLKDIYDNVSETSNYSMHIVGRLAKSVDIWQSMIYLNSTKQNL